MELTRRIAEETGVYSDIERKWFGRTNEGPISAFQNSASECNRAAQTLRSPLKMIAKPVV